MFQRRELPYGTANIPNPGDYPCYLVREPGLIQGNDDLANAYPGSGSSLLISLWQICKQSRFT